MKPTIAILSHLDRQGASPLGRTSLGNTYVTSVLNAGGIPVILPSVFPDTVMDVYINQYDGFLFSGGIDVSPSFYQEDSHEKLGETSIELDRTQIPFMKKALKAGKPVLGICRGSQVLNVACKGTLYQDNSEHTGTYIKHFQATDPGDISHLVHLDSDSVLSSLYGKTLWTNSYHHQSVKTPGEGVRVIARSNDGIVEAIQVDNHPFALGIQWHPEAMFAHGDESMRPLFEAFVRACLCHTGGAAPQMHNYKQECCTPG